MLYPWFWFFNYLNDFVTTHWSMTRRSVNHDSISSSDVGSCRWKTPGGRLKSVSIDTRDTSYQCTGTDGLFPGSSPQCTCAHSWMLKSAHYRTSQRTYTLIWNKTSCGLVETKDDKRRPVFSASQLPVCLNPSREMPSRSVSLRFIFLIIIHLCSIDLLF